MRRAEGMRAGPSSSRTHMHARAPLPPAPHPASRSTRWAAALRLHRLRPETRWQAAWNHLSVSAGFLPGCLQSCGRRRARAAALAAAAARAAAAAAAAAQVREASPAAAALGGPARALTGALQPPPPLPPPPLLPPVAAGGGAAGDALAAPCRSLQSRSWCCTRRLSARQPKSPPSVRAQPRELCRPARRA